MLHTHTEAELTPLEQRQKLLEHHVRLVAKKHSAALFCYGAVGGLGKSSTINRVLEEEGIEPILINSHVTPLALFKIMFQHRHEEVLFFDDCDTMYSSLPHLGLLRSALWNPRVVTYNSSKNLEGVPNSFQTTARFVFAANILPTRNAAFNAVLSRTDIFELSASSQEVLQMMRKIAAKGFQNITADDAAMVIDFIEEHSEGREISLRLLGPSLRKLTYARNQGIDWRPLIKSQLQTLGRKREATKRIDNKQKDLKVLQHVVNKYPDSVSQQQKLWCELTKKSRSTFYRLLNAFNRQV